MKESRSTEEANAVAEWLKNNEVTVCPPMQTTDPELMAQYTMWGKGRKKKATEAKKPAKKG